MAFPCARTWLIMTIELKYLYAYNKLIIQNDNMQSSKAKYLILSFGIFLTMTSKNKHYLFFSGDFSWEGGATPPLYISFLDP